MRVENARWCTHLDLLRRALRHHDDETMPRAEEVQMGAVTKPWICAERIRMAFGYLGSLISVEVT
jgi:hypothetical protein